MQTIFNNAFVRLNSAKSIMTELYGKHVVTERTFDEQSGRMTIVGYWVRLDEQYRCLDERYNFNVVLRPLANGKGFCKRPEVDELLSVEPLHQPKRAKMF